MQSSHKVFLELRLVKFKYYLMKTIQYYEILKNRKVDLLKGLKINIMKY
jgi:hypothetical protein